MNPAKSRTIINLSGACLNNLAGIYEAMGDYAKAEVPYRRSLAIFEKALDPEHPDTANRLRNLALLKIDLGRLTAHWSLLC
jgi:tetratricopeptide (TPR) repeat protein